MTEADRHYEPGREPVKAYRVYWSRNEKIEGGGIRVIKEVREGLAFDDARSLCSSLEKNGFMPFIAQSVRGRHEQS